MQSYTILLSMQHNNTDPHYIHIYKNIDTGSYQIFVNVNYSSVNCKHNHIGMETFCPNKDAV